MGVNIRPGDPLGNVLTAASQVDATNKAFWGNVKSIGAGTCDVLLESGGGLLQKKRIVGGVPTVGQRVEVRVERGEFVVYVPTSEAPSARGAGLVVIGGNVSSSGGGTSFPLPHASTHASGGSDPVSPASIGAATPADVAASMSAHLAASNPHPQYLLLAGGTMTGSLHMTTADLTGSLSSNPFTSGTTGWQITVDGDAEERNLLIRSSLYAQAFVFDLISTQAGTQYISKSAGALSAPMVMGSAVMSVFLEDNTDLLLEDNTALQLEVATWRMDVNDPPGTTASCFDTGDIINIKSEIVGVITETWFYVSDYTTNGDGTQHYTCTYAYGDLTTTYGTNTGVTDFGASDGTEQGILKATVIGANGPYYDVLTHEGTPWLGLSGGTPPPQGIAYQGLLLRGRYGKLSGITDTTYGALSGYGLYSQNVYLTGAVTATSGAIGPFTITSTKIYLGTGTFNDANTPFYADHNGGFSLKDRFFWNPLSERLYVDGEIIARSGAIGPFTLTASKLYMGTGIFRDANTPFYVDHNGAVSFNDRLYWNPISNYMKLDADELLVNGVVNANGLNNNDNTYTTELPVGMLKIGGVSAPQGAYIRIFGRDHATYPGQFVMVADTRNASNAAGWLVWQQYNGSFKTNLSIDKTGAWNVNGSAPRLPFHVSPDTFTSASWPGGFGTWGYKGITGATTTIIEPHSPPYIVSLIHIVGVACDDHQPLPGQTAVDLTLTYGQTQVVTMTNNSLTFAYNTDSSISVARTSGSDLCNVSLSITWV